MGPVPARDASGSCACVQRPASRPLGGTADGAANPNGTTCPAAKHGVHTSAANLAGAGLADLVDRAGLAERADLAGAERADRADRAGLAGRADQADQAGADLVGLAARPCSERPSGRPGARRPRLRSPTGRLPAARAPAPGTPAARMTAAALGERLSPAHGGAHHPFPHRLAESTTAELVTMTKTRDRTEATARAAPARRERTTNSLPGPTGPLPSGTGAGRANQAREAQCAQRHLSATYLAGRGEPGRGEPRRDEPRRGRDEPRRGYIPWGSYAGSRYFSGSSLNSSRQPLPQNQ